MDSRKTTTKGLLTTGSIWSLSACLLTSFLGIGSADAKGAGTVTLGIAAGHSGLLQEVGEDAGGSMGYAGQVGFAPSDEMVFSVTYLTSQHDANIVHSNTALGVDVYLQNFDVAYAYAGGGFCFLSNKFENDKVTANGFGLYLGGGLDLYLGKNLLVGLQGRYYKAFETTATVGSLSRTAIQDSMSVLAKVAISIGGTDN